MTKTSNYAPYLIGALIIAGIFFYFNPQYLPLSVASNGQISIIDGKSWWITNFQVDKEGETYYAVTGIPAGTPINGKIVNSSNSYSVTMNFKDTQCVYSYYTCQQAFGLFTFDSKCIGNPVVHQISSLDISGATPSHIDFDSAGAKTPIPLTPNFGGIDNTHAFVQQFYPSGSPNYCPGAGNGNAYLILTNGAQTKFITKDESVRAGQVVVAFCSNPLNALTLQCINLDTVKTRYFNELHEDDSAAVFQNKTVSTNQIILSSLSDSAKGSFGVPQIQLKADADFFRVAYRQASPGQPRIDQMVCPSVPVGSGAPSSVTAVVTNLASNAGNFDATWQSNAGAFTATGGTFQIAAMTGKTINAPFVASSVSQQTSSKINLTVCSIGEFGGGSCASSSCDFVIAAETHPQATCGDGVCNNAETYLSCPRDCKAPAPVCSESNQALDTVRNECTCVAGTTPTLENGKITCNTTTDYTWYFIIAAVVIVAIIALLASRKKK